MTVSFSGPLFDGTAQKLLRQGADEAEDQVAEKTRDLVRQKLRAAARQSSGYYESRVRAESGAGGDRVVTDAGVIYADWLAGKARRNKRSRFKGYQHWPQALEQMRSQATQIAEHAIDPYLNRMR